MSMEMAAWNSMFPTFLCRDQRFHLNAQVRELPGRT